MSVRPRAETRSFLFSSTIGQPASQRSTTCPFTSHAASGLPVPGFLPASPPVALCCLGCHPGGSVSALCLHGSLHVALPWGPLYQARRWEPLPMDSSRSPGTGILVSTYKNVQGEAPGKQDRWKPQDEESLQSGDQSEIGRRQLCTCAFCQRARPSCWNGEDEGPAEERSLSMVDKQLLFPPRVEPHKEHACWTAPGTPSEHSRAGGCQQGSGVSTWAHWT